MNTDKGQLTAYGGGGFVSAMSLSASASTEGPAQSTLLQTTLSELLTLNFDVTVSDATTLIGCAVILWRAGFDIYKDRRARHAGKTHKKNAACDQCDGRERGRL